MASTFVNNLRLEEMNTGEQSGQWGTKTNTNLELVGEALGFGTEAITTNADTHATTVADASSDAGRAIYIIYTGTLDSACTITIGPDTLKRVHIIKNGTSGSQNILIKQGAGAGAAVTIPNGDTKVVSLDGGGSGAIVTDVLASLSVVDLKVQDDLSFTSDSAVVSFGADADTTLTHTDGTGLTLNSTNKLCFNDASQFIQGASGTVLDIAATDTIELTATNIAVVGTMGATGKITADAGIDIDNINIDGTTIALSSGDLTVDVAGDIILNADGDDFKFQNATVNLLTITNSSSDAVIKPATDAKDIIFQQFDGTPVMTVEDNVSLAINNDITVAGRASGHVVDNTNSFSFDLATGNDFITTSNTNSAITFTNAAAGQSGNIKLVNGGNHTITAHADVAINADVLTTVSASGTYHLAYFCSAASGNDTILVSASAILT
tara:strand:+ start:594 stop:1907 length:1314 start_codon:yes stop_codon:yes gene_type:complete